MEFAKILIFLKTYLCVHVLFNNVTIAIIILNNNRFDYTQNKFLVLPFAQTRDREMFNNPEPYNNIKSKVVCNADDAAAISSSHNIDRLQTEMKQTCVNLGM